MNVRRIIAAGLAGSLALAACGGDDSTTAVAPTSTAGAGTVADDATTDPATTEVGSTDDSTGASTDGPAPTIAEDLPEGFLDGVGPVAVIGESLPPFPDQGDDPAVGLKAPVLVGETVDGEPVRIDASVDGPTWVVFLAHWCPHCNDEIPVINQLRDEGRIPDGVNVVGVSTAYSPERPNWPPDEWLADKDWTFTAINDGIDTVEGSYIAASAFGIGGFPFSMLLDGDGVVTARWSGERGLDDLESLVVNNLPLA